MFIMQWYMDGIKLGLLIIVFHLISSSLFAQDTNKTQPEQEILDIKKRGYSVDACYRIAQDFYRTNTHQIKAIPYLEYVIETDKDVDIKAFYMLANAYYYYGKFDKAIALMTQYLEKEKNRNLYRTAKQDLEKFRNAKRIASSPINAELINLGPEINSPFAEINPYISKQENLMVYSSNRSQSFNIYVSKKNKLETGWTKSKLAGNYVNSVNDEYVAGLSPNGKNLFIHYNEYNGFEDINMSTRQKGLYRELINPGSKVNSIYREEGAFMTSDGDTLYFASDRPGGYGGFDLYFSLRLPDGTFGQPINMGETINTKYDDNYPNLSPDGNRFYFASKGHNSIGGYDLFYCTLNDDKRWSTPINMGYPINNGFDNKSIAFTNDPRYAYFSTIDWRTNGDYDIYKVVFLDVEPEFLIVKTEVYIQEATSEIPFNNEDNPIDITVYNGQSVYGKYTYDKRKNSFIMALQPGTYIIDIESTGFKPYRKKINIKENYYKNNLRLLKIKLERE
jgi:hypothetical protein